MVAEITASKPSVFVTPAKAARILGVSRSTIYRWLENGRLLPLNSILKNRIPREQVENIRLGIQ